MTYFMYDAMGEEIDEPDEAQIRSLLAEISSADEEHPDVSLQHESGWSLSVFPDRFVRWQNVESAQSEPVDATLSSWDDVVGLLLMTARGETDEVTSALAAP
ncbi:MULTISPECIES: hypothetical protein [Streptomyces]|uniref:Uncharacterized protein n=1 Tax=Streptomyces mutomycini TaxID=284036 RepID=A0ABW0B426_9ACTN|nr:MULTISPECIES: hypothetical protein [Streptomyces]